MELLELSHQEQHLLVLVCNSDCLDWLDSAMVVLVIWEASDRVVCNSDCLDWLDSAMVVLPAFWADEVREAIDLVVCLAVFRVVLAAQELFLLLETGLDQAVVHDIRDHRMDRSWDQRMGSIFLLLIRHEGSDRVSDIMILESADALWYLPL